jgi:hypothetical protein
MKRLEDVMNEAEFLESKELATRMMNAFKDEDGNSIPVKTAQIMLACAMVVAGFVHKDIDTVQLLHESKNFQGNLFDAAVRAFKRDDGAVLKDLDNDPLAMAMMGVVHPQRGKAN